MQTGLPEGKQHRLCFPPYFGYELSFLVGGNLVWNSKKACLQVPALTFLNDCNMEL